MIEKIILKYLYFWSWIFRKWPGDKEYFVGFNAWFLQKVLRYRYKTITSNLGKISPKLTADQVNKIISQYYANLIRYIIEIIECIGFNETYMKAKIKINDNNHWQQISEKGTSIIMASHYGNWEISLTTLPLFVPHKVIAFYKPIKNQIIERLMKKLRSKHGLMLFPIDQTARVMIEFKDQPVWYIFVSDQGPLNMNGVYWNQFLGLDTPWLTGAEKLAKKYKYPVYYLHQIPSRNEHFYNLEMSTISTNPKSTLDGEITEKYSTLLAKEIEQDPSYWLWSHKRWKRADQKKAPPTN